MKNSPQTLTPDQMEALASGRRSDIFDDLRASGAASIAEMAKRLECSPKALYHHVRLLQDVGLVRLKAVRQGKRREEAVFEPVTTGTLMANERSETHRKTRVKMTNSMMRAAAKAYNTAQEKLRPDDPRLACSLIARSFSKLSVEQATEIALELKSLVERARTLSDSAEEDKYAVLVSITPIL